jgi:hypothetical protein
MRSILLSTLIVLLVNFTPTQSSAVDWAEALRHMPLQAEASRLNRTNMVNVILSSFQADPVVKAVVFMPGATDELYLFKRAQADLTNTAPTLLDAVAAITNQTLIRATFHPPFLLLHSDEDPLSPFFEVSDENAAGMIRSREAKAHLLYEDKDWNHVQYDLRKTLKVDVFPDRYRTETYHFYRHSFAGWHLDGLEYLQAVSLAGKTTFEIEKKRIVFRGDTRIRKLPTLDRPPGDGL